VGGAVKPQSLTHDSVETECISSISKYDEVNAFQVKSIQKIFSSSILIFNEHLPGIKGAPNKSIGLTG
jgi:hypothetical protein